jgi:hypothetical protein
MHNAWDPQQPAETLFKQIQDCVDYAEAGGITISKTQKMSTAYTKVFSTGNFHSSFHCWNERNPQDETWNNFKIHFVMAYHQHNKIQGVSAATSGYDNADVEQPADDDLTEASIDEFTNLATATSVDRGIISTLTDANSRLAKIRRKCAGTGGDHSLCSRRSALTVMCAKKSCLLLIITVGIVATRFPKTTQV